MSEENTIDNPFEFRAFPDGDKAALPEDPEVGDDPVKEDDDLMGAEGEGEGKKKRKKSSGPRKERNRTASKAEKELILANYASRGTSSLAKELNLTNAQVYNIVRTTRKELEKALEDENIPDEIKARIRDGLEKKLPKRSEFGGGAGAGRKAAAKPSVEEILARLGV